MDESLQPPIATVRDLKTLVHVCPLIPCYIYIIWLFANMHMLGFASQGPPQAQIDAEILQEQLLKAKYGGLLPKKKLVARDNKWAILHEPTLEIYLFQQKITSIPRPRSRSLTDLFRFSRCADTSTLPTGKWASSKGLRQDRSYNLN